jgi:molecular chaperone HtpG
MDRATLEGPLVTLFSSSKEHDEGKIGKYGVGFVSVFAIEPLDVVVATRRAREAWMMRLLPDYSYELEPAEPREPSGTRVTLHHRMDRDAFEAHVARSRAALASWCRHIGKPLAFVVHDRAEDAPRSALRIDRPFGVHGGVSIVARSAIGAIAVGTIAGEEHRPVPADEPVGLVAGFYNRGLTLHETRERFAGLDGVRFKVDSPKLAHTLSRDDVRRDDTFHRALAEVRGVVADRLPRAVRDALDDAAARAHRGEDEAAYRAALAAATAGPCRVPRDDVAVPLTDPFGARGSTRTVADAAELARAHGRGPYPFAAAPDALTATLAARGRPVVRAESAETVTAIERALGATLGNASTLFTRALVVDEPPGELTSALGEALASAGARTRRVAFARFEGAPAHADAAVVPESELVHGEAVIAARDLLRFAARWPDDAVVLLDVASPAIAAARRPGRTRERAHLLARVLLLDRGEPLTPRASDKLLAWALDEAR